ncbi:uncharacterized protein At1g65710 [Ziziphus jujuba]|uniref:Uncharacterized protein At1g65710 n=2 Tax=Ziziphus jujuba TaxID=326968 RepID=A0A6P3ZMC7_ZIZJJ|nr:uncharacterized protein At1g65710 [Ziziphus jujuba]KAH7534016.1 hypothetical protein FEM48_Zijuj04G0193000 [Ziziphus jujuba var. spinosa]
MGTCFSKKKPSSSSPPTIPSSAVADSGNAAKSSATVMADLNNRKPDNPSKAENTEMVKMKLKPEKAKEKQEQEAEEEQQQPATVKKEIFVIKHRKSHEGSRERDSKNPSFQQNGLQIRAKADGVASPSASSPIEVASVESVENKVPAAAVAMGVGVRTSSCTKEEVDAILIQCGRLSRSSSGKAASSSASCDRGRKYSGSKRSYDFDHCENDAAIAAFDDKKNENNEFDGDEMATEKRHSHRQRTRQSSRASPSSQGRRRTPSRERDGQQRSSSRERRVSRSPGRRSSETSGNNHSSTTNGAATTGNSGNTGSTNRPGKMVSVPATISSLVMDKSNNGDQSATATNGTIKRISVKRNVGEPAAATMAGSRTAASPRAQSPSRGNAIAKASNEVHQHQQQQQQQQPSLSRNSSRKAEQSPYRRNPLSEIDPNSLQYPQAHNNNNNINRSQQTKFKRETDQEGQEIHFVLNQKPNVEMNKTMNIVPQGGSNYRTNSRGTMDNNHNNNKVVNLPAQPPMAGPQSLTRTRSSRRSRDLDIDPENLLNPTPSYTRLLLEDIQNFHQKSTTTTNVATVVSLPPCVSKACSILEAVADLNSTTSSNLSCSFSEDRTTPPPPPSNGYNYSLAANLVGKNMSEKDPFVESEVISNDDLTEPSFHKYVTVRRGGVDMEDQESSGSNSFVGGVHQQQWSSSWEPNSADSTDCWTSRSKSPVSMDMAEAEAEEEAWRRVSGRKSGGIGRGRLGGASNKGLHAIPVAAAAASSY